MLPAPLFWFIIRKWAQSIVCISLVHDCIRLLSFVHLLLFYCSPLTFLLFPGWGGWDMLSPFSEFGFGNGLNRLYFVSTWLYTSFFVCTLHTFYLSQGGAGYPPFLILNSKVGLIVCTSLVHDCICPFLFVHLLLFSTSSCRGLGHAITSFSDFGFENGLNLFYFVTTWLYTSFFICTFLLALTILRCISSIHV